MAQLNSRPVNRFLAYLPEVWILTPTLLERINLKPSALIFLVFRLIINNLCKLRFHKKVFEDFQKFIPQERHIRILVWGLYSLFLNFLLMIPTKILITNFCEELRNFFIIIFYSFSIVANLAYGFEIIYCQFHNER